MVRRSLFCLTACTLLFTSLAFAEGDAAKGKEVYDKICSQCHGPTGLGDGPVGQNLPPNSKPASFQAATFKYATDDAKMADLLKKGGAAVGLSPLMPPQPTLSDEEISNVIAYVHTLKK